MIASDQGKADEKAKAAVQALGLTQAQSNYLLRLFRIATRLSQRPTADVDLDRTRSAIDLLAGSTLALELAGLDSEIGDELSEMVSRYLALDRTVPAVDLMLALEKAASVLSLPRKLPGRPMNMPLFNAVRILLPAIEDAVSGVVRVRWNKTKFKAPEAGNAAAEVLITLTKLAVPKATTTAVCNMIQKVRDLAQ